MASNDRDYKRENLTVHWQPALCTHCENCFQRLPEVFEPTRRPWVFLDAASLEKIKEVVDECPSGALSYSETNNGI